jgi:hypothetical protein
LVGINIGYQHTVSEMLFISLQLQIISTGSKFQVTVELDTDKFSVNDTFLEETKADIINGSNIYDIC